MLQTQWHHHRADNFARFARTEHLVLVVSKATVQDLCTFYALGCDVLSPLDSEVAVKPEAERRRLEETREREFLREQGVKEEDLPKLTSQTVRNTYAHNLLMLMLRMHCMKPDADLGTCYCTPSCAYGKTCPYTFTAQAV